MHAERIMNTKLVTAQADECIRDVLLRMRQQRLRMLPVLDANQVVVGLVSTFSILAHIVPDYIISGDLEEIPYAPDMGVLHQHYGELADQTIASVMESAPLLIHKNESLLAVSASILSSGKHEYALVVDDNQALLGIISAGDILEELSSVGAGDA